MRDGSARAELIHVDSESFARAAAAMETALPRRWSQRWRADLAGRWNFELPQCARVTFSEERAFKECKPGCDLT